MHPAYLFGDHSLHDGRRQIGKEGRGAVEAAQSGIAAIDVGPAVFSAEYSPFAEDGQSLQGGRTAAADNGICQDPVIESQFNAVVIPVECHRFHINVGGDQFGTANPCVDSGIQNGLGVCG